MESQGRKCSSGLNALGRRNFSEHRHFSKSRQGEDAYLWNYFGDICDGSYIELGALDGVKYSNSHAFNKALNWSGILIEASPINAVQLKRNRPNDITVHAAVCEHKAIVHYVEDTERGGAVGGIWEFMAETFKRQWHKDKSIADTTEIPCAPLAEIVEQHTKQTFFDFLSLDVEGGEYSVIQTLGPLQFGMVIVEADRHDPRKNSLVELYLIKKGYILTNTMVAGNQVYINAKFDEIYNDIIT
jgi:FkbM family methyltransferase